LEAEGEGGEGGKGERVGEEERRGVVIVELKNHADCVFAPGEFIRQDVEQGAVWTGEREVKYLTE